MKRITTTLAAVLIGCMSLCAQQPFLSKINARRTPEWFRCCVTYQLQMRSFTPEGTIKAAEAKLPMLKDLGVTLVYLTPVNVSDGDMNLESWSPRQKKSGLNNPRNPYRPYDYFHVDPEYGTDNDLKEFINHAHSLGMYVMLDMVFAHCGPSAPIVKLHPEYFKYDENGRMKTTQWLFPELDHNNSATRAFYRTVLCYYLADFDVDGFRCDVSDAIPIDFWEEARDDMEAIKPQVAMVAESLQPYNTRKAFDCVYGWKTAGGPMLNLLKEKGASDASKARKAIEDYIATMPKGSLIWNFTDNHDYSNDSYENRYEKVLGHENQELGLAFNFAFEGIPFIFNGQEIAFGERVSIFGHEGGWIDWEKAWTDCARKRFETLQHFAELRRSYPALTHGTTEWIDNDCPEKVLSFRRTAGDGRDILFIGNFSDKQVKVKLADGTQKTLAAWGYYFGSSDLR